MVNNLAIYASTRCATRLLVALVMASTANASPQAAKSSWWDRTANSQFSAQSHRIRSDLPQATSQSTAEGIDRLWLSVDSGLGQLRPRSLGLQQALLFFSQEDLTETLRTQFAVDAPSEACAFFSPLGQGIAVCTEDTPPPVCTRALTAAIVGEYLRICCGGDLPPALQTGLADLLARVDHSGLESGIGEAGLAITRDCAASTTGPRVRDLLLMDRDAWKLGQATGASEQLNEQASSVVRFLTAQGASIGLAHFQRYLRLVCEGTMSADAFALVYGVRDDAGWEQFDARWRAFALAEKPSATETVRERLAFLGEGLRALDGEGATPSDLARLELELKERDIVSPAQWRPGFSQVRSQAQGAGDPTGSTGASGSAAKPKPRAKGAHFELGAVQAGVGKAPPEILVVGDHKIRLKLIWLKTRPEPEAPWVWDIGRGN